MATRLRGMGSTTIEANNAPGYLEQWLFFNARERFAVRFNQIGIFQEFRPFDVLAFNVNAGYQAADIVFSVFEPHGLLMS